MTAQKRKIGSHSVCEICGELYTVKSGHHKYCTGCIPEIAGQMSNDPMVIQVCSLYMRGYSIHAVAQATKASDQKIRRILIQYGLYTNDTIQHINHLYSSGLSIDQIASEIGCGRKSVISMLPYDKGMYGLITPSKTAAYLRNLRKKEKKT